MRCDRRDFQSIQVWFGPSEQIIPRLGGFGPGQNWWFASESGSATVFIRQTWWVRCITLDRWDTSLSSRCMGGCERQGQQAITRWALWHQASRNNLAPGINNLALGITCRSNCLRHSPQAPRQHDTSYILEKWSVTLWSDRQLFGIVITKQLCASIPVAPARTMLECLVWMVSSYLHSVCSTLHCLLSSLSHQKDERSYSRGKVWWGGH